MRFIIIFAFLCMSCGRNAQLHWSGENINITVDSSCGFRYNAALALALDEWNQVLEGKRTITIRKNSINKVVCFKKWDGETKTLADTRLTYDVISGDIEIFSINFNQQYHKFSLKAKQMHHNLTTVMLHEVGHALGLDHENGANCVMFYAPSENSETMKLCENEKRALRKIYGIN